MLPEVRPLIMSRPLRHARSSLPLTLLLLLSGVISACATRSGPGLPGHELRFSGYDSPALFSESSTASDALPHDSLRPPALDAEALEQAGQAEAERTLNALWTVVSTTDSPGAEWEFHIWSQDGALTILSLKRTEQGEGRAAPMSKGAFLKRLERELPTLLGPQPREVTLTLEREETQWSADLDTSSRDSPPAYARTLPSARGGTSDEKYRQALEVARRVARLMTVPRGGGSRLKVQVMLEDDRIVGWEPGDLDSSGDGPALLAPEEAVTTLLGALLPFVRGLGERTVALTLQGEHRQGEARPRWLVVEARTLEPPPPPMEVADFNREYRELHEHILVEFQEQSRHYAVLAASFTLEQIAYTVVGGILINRALVLFEVAAPTVASILARGGKGAVSWFRTLLVRAGPEERVLLQRLWMKVETQGLKSLTVAERQQFSALMGRLEKVLGTPLDENAKRDLWRLARKEYFELHHPELAELLGKQGLSSYQVHHICPMEYAHLFPKLDINGKTNLAGLHEYVHRSINKVWSSVRDLSARMRPDDVQRVVDIVNRHYGRWFNQLYELKDASALSNAERAALSEVAQLKALLSP